MRRRRLQLGIHQSEAACRLGISTVTLSRWECDKVYPTWAQQPAVAAYLGYDPFTNPALGRPKSNETQFVAFLSSEAPANIGQEIVRHCIKMRKTRKQFAKEIGINAKTIRGWETGRRHPSVLLQRRIMEFLKSCAKIGQIRINPRQALDSDPRLQFQLRVQTWFRWSGCPHGHQFHYSVSIRVNAGTICPLPVNAPESASFIVAVA